MANINNIILPSPFQIFFAKHNDGKVSKFGAKNRINEKRNASLVELVKKNCMLSISATKKNTWQLALVGETLYFLFQQAQAR